MTADRSPREALGQALLVGVSTAVFAVYLGHVLLKPSWAFGAGVAGALLAVAALAWFAARGLLPPRALLALYVVATAAWAWMVSSQQVSDFGVYLRCGADHLAGWTSLQTWAARCESEWLPGFGTYWRRSLLYSLPVGWLSGGAYAGFKLANALFHVAAVFLLYRGTAAALGRAPGIVAAGLLALYPEFWFVTTVVSSDNLAVVAMVALLVGLATLGATPSVLRLAFIVALVGVLDLLRSVGPILLFALVLLALFAPAGERRPLLVAAVAAWALTWALGWLPQLAGIATRQNDGLLATLLSNGVARPSGFDVAYGWHQYILPLFDPQGRAAIVAGFLGHEAKADSWFPGIWMLKIVALLEGDGYYFFSNAGPMGNPDDVVLPGATGSFGFTAPGTLALRGVMAVFCALAAAGFLRGARHPLVRTCTAFAAAFLLLVVIVGEAQPRYSVLVAPALCIAAASLLAARGGATRSDARLGVLGAVLVAGGTLVSVPLVRLAADIHARGAPELAWRAAPDAGSGCAAASAAAIDPNRVVLDFAAGSCQALQAVPARLDGPLVLHALRTPVPPKWKKGPFPEVDLVLTSRSADGAEQRVTTRLGPQDVVARIVVPGERMTLLRLEARSAGAAPNGVYLGFLHDGRRAVANFKAPR